MPTYEYICNDCGHKFEEFQGMNEPPLQTCPRCTGKVKRLIGHGGGLLFRGSGFYVTDYKGLGKNNGEKEKSPVKKSKNQKIKNNK